MNEVIYKNKPCQNGYFLFRVFQVLKTEILGLFLFKDVDGRSLKDVDIGVNY